VRRSRARGSHTRDGKEILYFEGPRTTKSGSGTGNDPKTDPKHAAAAAVDQQFEKSRRWDRLYDLMLTERARTRWVL
jgi:hypothetical protein